MGQDSVRVTDPDGLAEWAVFHAFDKDQIRPEARKFFVYHALFQEISVNGNVSWQAFNWAVAKNDLNTVYIGHLTKSIPCCSAEGERSLRGVNSQNPITIILACQSANVIQKMAAPTGNALLVGIVTSDPKGDIGVNVLNYVAKEFMNGH